MRAVVQKVLEANIEILHDEELMHVNHIEHGLVVLVDIDHNDTETDISYIANKVANMRVFKNGSNEMSLSVQDVDGEILLLPQRTILTDYVHDDDPQASLLKTTSSQQAKLMYHNLTDHLLDMGLLVKTGQFQTHMYINLTHDGPITVFLDSQKPD